MTDSIPSQPPAYRITPCPEYPVKRLWVVVDAFGAAGSVYGPSETATGRWEAIGQAGAEAGAGWDAAAIVRAVRQWEKERNE